MFRGIIGDVARMLLGEPNSSMSSQKELRYGHKGSLAILLDKDSFYDHENNEGGGVLDLIKREMTNIHPMEWLRSNGFIEEKQKIEYIYKTESEKLFVKKIRNPKPGVSFWWNHYLNGKWLPTRGPNTLEILYHLPEVISAIKSEQTIFVVEGEKDVDNVCKLNLCATCSPDGAAGMNKRTGKPATPKWYKICSEQLRDADIIVLNDNDVPGKLHANATMRGCLGIAKRIRWLDIQMIWPKCPKKGDISDWLAQGGTEEQFSKATKMYCQEFKKVEDGFVITQQEIEAFIRESTKSNGQTNWSGFVFNEDEFLAAIKPPEYLIDGLLQRRYVYSLTGPSGHGKTCVVLRVAAHVVTGVPLNGMEIEKSKVLYFAGENPDDVGIRWLKTRDDMEISGRTEIYWIRGTPPMTIADIKKRIIDYAKQHGPFGLVIVDTSAAYFKGDDENNNAQLGDYARMLRSLIELDGGPTVLVTCHPIKNPDPDYLVPRGGGAYLNEVDGNLAAVFNGTIVKIETHGKFRGPEFAPFSFKLVPGTCKHERAKDAKGRLIWTVTAIPITDEEEDTLSDAVENRQDELAQMMVDRPGLSLNQLAEAMGWRTFSGALNKSLVYRIIKKMDKEGIISKKRGRYELKEKAARDVKGNKKSKQENIPF